MTDMGALPKTLRGGQLRADCWPARGRGAIPPDTHSAASSLILLGGERVDST